MIPLTLRRKLIEIIIYLNLYISILELKDNQEQTITHYGV